MDLAKRLKDRIVDYKYGRHNLIDGKFNIRELENSFIFDNFYSGISKTGVCNEQHENFFQENSDLNLLRVIGSEPKYFNDSLSNHFYLLSFEKKLPNDFDFFSDKDKRSYIETKNPYIIDVSFGVIEKIKNSGYSLRKPLEKFPINKDMEFVKANSPLVSPLGIHQNRMFYIGARKNLEIFFNEKEKANVESIGSINDAINCIKKNSDLGKILHTINLKYNVPSK